MKNCGALAGSYLNSFPFVSNVMGISLAIFAPITVLLNALLMASFIATKQVRLNTSNFLIMCLSLSDLLNGAVTMPLVASILYKFDLNKSCEIFNPVQATNGFFVAFSAILTVLIAIDRYLNMNPNVGERSSRCAKVFQRPNIYCIVTGIAIGLVIYSSTITYAIAMGVKSMAFGVLLFLCSLSVTLGICAVAILYAKAYVRIRNFTDASPIYKERNGSTMRPQYVRNLYKSVLVLVVTTMLVYLPLSCANIAVTINALIGSKDLMVVHTFLHFAELLLYFNCIINSLVILWFNKTAKQWVQTKIQSCFLRRRRETVKVTNDIAIVSTAQQRQADLLATKP